MMESYQPIATLLAAVRARRRRVVLFTGCAAGGVLAAAILAAVLLSVKAAQSAPVITVLGVGGLVAIVGAFVWALRGSRARPSDVAIARFVEERHPGLDERLVSAASLIDIEPGQRPMLADLMVRDAARSASAIDPASIVPQDAIRRAAIQACVAALVFLAVAFAGRRVIRQSTDAIALSLFPSRVALEVTPGDTRVAVGAQLGIAARLVGNRAPVTGSLQWTTDPESEDWQTQEMRASTETDARDDASPGRRFQTTLSNLTQSFSYRVVAGGLTSRTFKATVVSLPRIERIDLEYTYPKALGMAPRTEKDGGDIYAPAGTDVRVVVHTDHATANGALAFAKSAGGVALTPDLSGRSLSGTFTVGDDDSYRIGITDRDGMHNPGETEYFVRVLDDRPPEVRVVQPAADRRVTALEEVQIVAEADDDFGVASMDLVYAVHGGVEKVVPFRIEPKATSVSGRHTLYLEDLDVRPGDFVSYYVRARDLERGKRSSETRSDIFFLEIKPFEEEFSLAQSQAAMGGGASNPQIDDLVNAQKEVIVATWKLDRRARAAAGAKSAQDVRAVGAAESELKTKVERTSSQFGTSRLRSPRRPTTPGRGSGPRPAPPAPVTRAGQTLAEEDAMTLAATAMGQAVDALNALKTNDAVGPEMEALNQLLRAQADVKKREIQRQQAGGGAGGNRSSQDLSSLFDKELARHQETNYETRTNASSQSNQEKDNALDKIKELASRQDELTKRQQELARNQSGMSGEERKRQLEKLTREQAQLQQRVEALAQQMQQQNAGQQSSGDKSQQQSQSGAPQASSQGGQQSTQRPGQQSGQSGRPGDSGERRPGEGQNAGTEGDRGSRELRRISEEMKNATGDLQRQNAAQASERAQRALDDLRSLEQQMQGSSPDGRRRALGDLQLEARQLADAERRVANDAARAGQNGDADALRRLAGEQERLSERLGRAQDALRQQAQGSGGAPGADPSASRDLQRAADDASREIDRQRLRERMDQSAQAMRGAAGTPGGKEPGSQASREDIAKSLERIADRLSAAGNARGSDSESQKLAGNMARVQELRDRLDAINQQLEQLNRNATGQSSGQGSSPGERGQNSPNGRQSGSSNPAGQPGQPNQTSPSQPSPGGRGQTGVAQNGTGGSAEVARLQQEAARTQQEVRQLLGQTAREDNAFGQGGVGRTLDGQGMVLSAPGTEGFKQDFAKWQELNRQMTEALDRIESSVSKRLGEKQARERLAAGADDAAPAQYQQQVDAYFKALAARKKP